MRRMSLLFSGGLMAALGRSRRRSGCAKDASDDRDDGFGRALAEAACDFPRWLARRRGAIRQYVEIAAGHLDELRSREPDLVRGTLAAADAFLDHRFDLLGSGPFSASDPDRRARGTYQPIDWHLDPVRRLRFPRDVPYKEWRLFEMRPGNADIKYPWELARCQHWITLAQAWRLTRDPRYAVEIAAELEDFTEVNPVGLGINWTCTMDVAIRAANWALALALIPECAELDERFWRRAYSALFDHGEFIYGNLENHYEVTSNHFLSNVVGLHILAAEFGDLAVAAGWDSWCRGVLETEIEVQVYEEGTDFESAVPYHRLVTELFLASARLAELQRRPLSENYRAKLQAMVEFLLAVTRPDGRMPVIGDCDDGRLHIFSRFGAMDPQYGRHLIAPAARLLDRAEWLAWAGPAASWEAAWWGFDPASAVPGGNRAPLPAARIFPESGIAVGRGGAHYLAITNGAVGTRGFGNHKHNELLSFEYHLDGVPVIVDPGSYVYTSDAEARNLFRSTAYHNTVVVDGAEQNEINPEWIFRLFEKSNPEHIEFAEQGDWLRYRGRHHGYERLESPVTHERLFLLNRRDGVLLIEDRLSGAGVHDLQWHFHLGPGADVAVDEHGQVLIRFGELLVRIRHDLPSAPTVVPGWYSPSYGRRYPAPVLGFALRSPLEGRSWRFAIGSHQLIGDRNLSALLAAAPVRDEPAPGFRATR